MRWNLVCHYLLLLDDVLTVKLERMMKKWAASTYAFFEPIPTIEYHHSRKAHVFACGAKGCKHSIARYLDTTDRESTGNMRKHICSCWVLKSWAWLIRLRLLRVPEKL